MNFIHKSIKLDKRIPEPELMCDSEQVESYSTADFEAPHEAFVSEYLKRFHRPATGKVVDLGCGSGDVTSRFARHNPECDIDAVDGSAEMINWARRRSDAKSLRITFHVAKIPFGLEGLHLQKSYDVLLSNSLLHHLPDPMVLWSAVKELVAPGGTVLIGDLMRPLDSDSAAGLIGKYASETAPIGQQDFYNSLCAAYRPEEVNTQLLDADINWLKVEIVSDRHMLVWGSRPQ